MCGLQETRARIENFPHAELAAAAIQHTFSGEDYNGVPLLARTAPTELWSTSQPSIRRGAAGRQLRGVRVVDLVRA